MKKITLDSVIEEQNAKSSEFKTHYQRELLINEIASMVHQLRQAAHLTQEQLASRAHTTQPVIARLESGSDNRIPSLALLARIAVASNATLHLAFHKTKLAR
jgi:DNA-binding XRE family transcriptional regulator